MSDQQQAATTQTTRCFVVMGFGIKTDFETGRKLDLDKSYRLLIKPVVEQKGIECIRADEIRHSGTIDVPMYQELLAADIVIADLSTANPNALYELGIRHALKPRTTIVISESKLRYPFDLNHVVITKYTHLGDAIDFDEVMRFRDELGKTLEAVLRDKKTDSPVYTFLSLTPPLLTEAATDKVAKAAEAVAQAGQAITAVAKESRPAASASADPSLAILISQGEQAVANGQFSAARALFAAAQELAKKDLGGAIEHDPYMVQRLALATYKAKEPDPIAALRKALEILGPLHPDESNDPETVGLAGAIEKRLFETGQGAEHLGMAIWYYGRGFYLRYDWYNGINFAYLLNVRTDSSLDPTAEEKIADLVWANRVRREIVALCERDLRGMSKMMQATGQSTGERAIEQARLHEQTFWCLASKAEAHFGLGEIEAYRQARSEAEKFGAAAWMMGTFDEQIGKLAGLLAKHGHLLNPPWPRDAAAKAQAAPAPAAPAPAAPT